MRPPFISDEIADAVAAAGPVLAAWDEAGDETTVRLYSFGEALELRAAQPISRKARRPYTGWLRLSGCRVGRSYGDALVWTAEVEFNVWSAGARVVESADQRVIVGGHALGRDEVTGVRAALHDDRPAVLLEGSVPDAARLVIQADEPAAIQQIAQDLAGWIERPCRDELA